MRFSRGFGASEPESLWPDLSTWHSPQKHELHLLEYNGFWSGCSLW